MGMVIALASGKGGVGKSTVTCCLGIQLAKEGKRVLLVDADAGLSSLDRLLKVDEELIYNISDVFNGRCGIKKAIYECSPFLNLFLLPAPESIENKLTIFQMHKLLEYLKDFYDYILIDCPGGVESNFEAAVSYVDKAIIISNINPISLKNAKKVKNILINKGIIDIRLVINEFDKKTFIKSGMYNDLDEVIDEAGVQLIAVLPKDVKSALMFLKGKIPNKHSSLSKKVKNLSQRIQGKEIPLKSLNNI